MSMATLFEWADFAPETPEWAESCFYCVPDAIGCYDQARHLANHLPMTCGVCGETMPNRLLYENNHGVSLGGSWEHNVLLCTSLWLRLNHLSYDITHGRCPDERDLTAIDLGWRIAPDGTQLPPESWPPAPTDTAIRTEYRIAEQQAVSLAIDTFNEHTG